MKDLKDIKEADSSQPPIEAEAEVLTAEQVIALDIMDRVKPPTEPCNEEEALEWELAGQPCVARMVDLVAEAKRVAVDHKQYLLIFAHLSSERFRRMKEFHDATYEDPSVTMRKLNERLDERKRDVYGLIDELKVRDEEMVSKITDEVIEELFTELNGLGKDEQDKRRSEIKRDRPELWQGLMLYQIRERRKARRMRSAEYELMHQTVEDVCSKNVESILGQLQVLLGDDFFDEDSDLI